MSNWTIGKRMIVGFSGVIAVVLALGAFAFVRLVTIGHAGSTITEVALPGVAAMGEISRLVRDNRAMIVEHMLSPTPQRKDAIEAAMKTTAGQIDTLGKAYEETVREPEGQRLIDAVAGFRQSYRDVRENVVLPLSRENKTAEAFDAFENQFKPVMLKYFDALQAEVEYNSRNGIAYGHDIDLAVGSAKVGIIVGLLAAVLVSAGLAFVIVSSTNTALRMSLTELSNGAHEVVQAAGQVSISAQSLSLGAAQQAASLEETSASMEEMASMTRQNAANATLAATLVTNVTQQVTDSNAALGHMVASMSAIKASSSKVAKIIKTIDEIAFQTNILALNAAVEAARAGEAGKGFAVVADEVRNLAQRSAQAAKDTAALIEESIARSHEGTGNVTEVATAIGAITGSVAGVKGIVDEVREASQQQTQGIDQVAQALARMEKVTQTTAATAEQSAAASEELNAQAETAMAVVRQLERLVGRGTAAPSVPEAAMRPATLRTLKTDTSPTHVLDDDIPVGRTGTFGGF
jgi:methyl-accepting chemotaxis protein